jgi:predicted PhzF superfamily epimerase YddE/YHI9
MACVFGISSVAIFRRERGHLAAAGIDYLAAQGQCAGRSGRVAVRFESPERITIGGACVTTVAGTLRC